ncbi:NAD(P)H-binding protein [Neobacillus sp. PS3-40]|uniref:NAD(P)-dependent oxidoreductase n=1 Tax=Neobacillus sp. PS3-40 TaxID=3070679 RepID=UPI0027E0C3EE|nr:NAD(P)H-binding protein [Neobacillus sp. PS3-40]WML43271.1 NAD(P)H-binding protein [Neobacillus sp. PS3-40]
MNICLLGASGRVGSVVLERALSNNYNVHALVRDTTKLLTKSQTLTIFEGNSLHEKDVAAVMKGTDVVICALNTEGTTTLSESMPIIIREMGNLGIKRIISIGTAGILQARTDSSLYRFQSSESRRKSTKDAEEHLKAYLKLKDSGLDWTIVCPTYLPLGERVGSYRYEANFLPENPSSISVFDTADFAFQQLFTDQFIRLRVGITY